MMAVESATSVWNTCPVTNLDNAADNECAEALLQLAMSVSPPNKAEFEQRTPGVSSDKTLTSPKYRRNRSYSVASAPSFVKEDCGSSPDYGSGFTEEQEIGGDLVNRIRLDHNYCWPGDEKSRPVEYASLNNNSATSDSLLEEILGDDVGIPPRWNKENSMEAPLKGPLQEKPRKKN